MRRFEEQYRLNEGDDVLNRENAIHQDVDLRLDAVEQDAEAFRAGNRADIEAILKSLEQTFGSLAAEMRGLLDQTVGGLSADIVVETSARYFLTDARRSAILSDLRGGVDASGDTMAKLLALIVAVVGGAPVGRQSLKAINDAVVANTATLNAITSGADPTLDSFAEALTRFVIDEGQIAGLMTMVGNRLRGDADGQYSAAQVAQFLANLGLTDRQPGVGDLVVTIGKVAPPGCLKLNGSLISRANYPALWTWAQANGNLITDALWTGGASAAFSQGDGSTTFRIPDFRGEFPRFWDDSRGLDAGRALGSVQAQSYQAHAHGFTGTGGGGYPNFASEIMVMSGVTPDQYNQVGAPGFSGRPDYYQNGGRDDVRIASSGGSETRPRNVSPLACIRYK